MTRPFKTVNGRIVELTDAEIARREADAARWEAGRAARQVEAMRLAVSAHVDATARSRGYDSAVSIASYVASTNPAWAAEAAAFVSWRDAVWEHALAALAAVLAGGPEPDSEADFLAELPAIDWPEHGQD